MAVSRDIRAPGFSGIPAEEAAAFNAQGHETQAPQKSQGAIAAHDGNFGRPPSVALIGAGGCGINLTRALQSTDVAGLLDGMIWIDTSYANVRQGEAVHIIANGDGGGKDQSMNFDAIQKNFEQFRHLPDADVYILAFGLSGASGSVLGTVAVRNLLRRGKTVVVAVVAETASQVDSENTENTLISLQEQANEHYLPMILAENIGGHRTETDRYVRQQISDLIRILKLPTTEVDRNDRLSWLNPDRAVRVDMGIHMLYVDSDDAHIPAESGLLDDTMICDSVLSLGVVDQNSEAQFITNIGQRSRFRKSGILADGGTPTSGPLIGIIVNNCAPVDTIVNSIESSASLFNSQSHRVTTRLKVDKANLSESGMAFKRRR